MAETSDSTTSSFEPPEIFKQAAEKAREFNETLLESAQKAGQQPLEQTGKESLQRYVEWLDNVAEEQTKFASSEELGKVSGVSEMLKAQADFTKNFASSLSKFVAGGSEASDAEGSASSADKGSASSADKGSAASDDKGSASSKKS